MCGITGYITTKPNQAKNAKQTMADLLLYSSSRGTDATGIAFVHNEKIICVKKGIPASKFIQSAPYKNAIKRYSPKIMIGHTRAKTQGDQKDNNNNHPLIAGNIALVHNGVLYNEDDVFKDFKLERKGEVDSEAIVQLVNHFKTKKSDITRVAIQCTCKEIRGNMAIAVINAKNDRELHLVSSGNPCVLAYQKSTGTIFFASELDILKYALYQGKQYHRFFYDYTNTDDFIFRELDAEEGVRLTAEKTSQYKVERYVYSYKSDYDYSSYHRGEHWEGGAWVKDVKPTKKGKAKQQSLLPEPKKKEKKYTATFDKRESVKKPSQYCTDDLLDRLELLEDMDANKQTINEVNEVKRILNTLEYRVKHDHDYATSHDYKKPVRHPQFYALDDLEVRVNTLEELQGNGAITAEEQQEYEALYEHYMERATEDEDEADAPQKRTGKGAKDLADEQEAEYEAKADGTKKTPAPATADMQSVVDAENADYPQESMYADHRHECWD